MRLIDADALKKRILEERDKIPLTVPAASYEFVKEKANSHGNAMRGGIRVALRCMEQTPTVDAELVRHGEWGETRIIGYDGIHPVFGKPCSECGYMTGLYKPNYCPNCGAKLAAKDINVPTKEG